MGLQEKMEQLRRRYVASLPDKIATLENLLLELERSEPPPEPASGNEAGDAVRSFAHKLAGSGGSYGFLAISEVAGSVERAPDRSQLVREGHRLVETLERAHRENEDDNEDEPRAD